MRRAAISILVLASLVTLTVIYVRVNPACREWQREVEDLEDTLLVYPDPELASSVEGHPWGCPTPSGR